jgi:hypothetical protein
VSFSFRIEEYAGRASKVSLPGPRSTEEYRAAIVPVSRQHGPSPGPPSLSRRENLGYLDHRDGCANGLIGSCANLSRNPILLPL